MAGALPGRLRIPITKHGNWYRGFNYSRILLVSEDGVATLEPGPDARQTNIWPWESVVGFTVSEEIVSIILLPKIPAAPGGIIELKFSVADPASKEALIDRLNASRSSGDTARRQQVGAQAQGDTIMESAVAAARTLLEARAAPPSPTRERGIASALALARQEWGVDAQLQAAKHEQNLAHALQVERSSWEAKLADWHTERSAWEEQRSIWEEQRSIWEAERSKFEEQRLTWDAERLKTREA